MPLETQLAHRNIRNTNLPYQTNVSPTQTDPYLAQGSKDILTSINGYAERRPGFADFVEQTPTTFNNLQRIFSWDRFDGTFIIMFCDVSPTNMATVYKYQVGLDTSAVEIYIGTSALPFDFVVSNNTVYFSDGVTAAKWDPVNGVSNWGIAIGSVANSTGPNTATVGATSGTGGTWTNPSNITTTGSSYATTTLPFTSGGSVTRIGITSAGSGYYSGAAVGIGSVGGGSGADGDAIVQSGHVTGVTVTNGGSGYTQNQAVTFSGSGSGAAGTAFVTPGSFYNYSKSLQGTGFGFTIPSTTTITGISISVSISATISGGTATATFPIQLIANGETLGNPENLNFLIDGTVRTVATGSATDTWGAGTALNAGAVSVSTFGFQLTPTITVLSGSPTLSISVNSFKVTVYGIGGPSVTLVAGGFSPAPSTGYFYVFCYGNSNTGHISSPTPISSLIKPDGTHSVQISLTASIDPQVNQIRLFRTVDGGGSPLTFFELPTSPYPNTTANVVDAEADTALNVSSIAPTATFNDPPTPGRAAQYFSGRVWLFNGNKVAFSGLEEIVQGVPEESFPSGTAGNYWTFDQPVQAEGVTGSGQNQALGVFCGGRLYGIVGNTLDTFQRYSVSQRRGCRAVACTASLGGMVAWLDSSNQIWATDGSTLNELSTDIRPDLVGLNPANCSMTFHVSGRFHWMVFSTGTKLYLYDMDLEQWMPPWNFACQYIYSGETSAGNYVLMAATATTALQLNITKFNDNGATYQPILNFGNLAVVPDFGKRFSYVAAGIYDEPSRTGYPNIFQITNNAQSLADVLMLTDEDPKQGIYTSVAANLQDTSVTYNRKNGTFMKQWVYPVTQPAARWVSWQVKLANADQVDNIYEAFMAYKGVGGR